MVAAWISAETGVGPSIASGNQVWSRNCADLPIAPMNNSRQSVVRISTSQLPKMQRLPDEAGRGWNTVLKSSVPKMRNTPKIPSEKPKSPMRLTMKALIAAAFALGRSYQNPMSK